MSAPSAESIACAGPDHRDVTDWCGPRPKLLVSVGDAEEAGIALRGGADILDIKDVRRGSLGMATPAVMEEIVRHVRTFDAAIPVTAALGEVTDWFHASQAPVLPGGLAALKLGLAGCGRLAMWDQNWLRVRRIFEDLPSARPAPAWVAVAYADWQAADAPSPDAVLDAAIASRCAGFLIDTWTKGAGDLTAHLSWEQWAKLVERARQSGLFVAAAGQIGRRQIATWPQPLPDIFAVRSAACGREERGGRIDGRAVGRLCECISRKRRGEAGDPNGR